ncbi:ferritin [Nocardioides sp. zg-1308]|uniref:Ferritin n=1 Tax=Nocardioides renjunii TaxID=3095075 RepID=A0ABU5K933_9ACTN|nr:MULTISPECIES: ferritin [unclassified Nocardioides]MDZ5661468.1 ferritin [Nocardioides sp. S-58]NPD04575.1 ferritin [Nocardioides sp. zg-1308]
MKLSENLEHAFNAQITLEFQASLVYRQLAIELELMDLSGIARWFRAQADEEILHAHKFIDHVSDRDNHPRIGAVQAPVAEVGSVLDAFEAAFAHEQKVSESIRSLYRQAEAEGDLDSRPLLNWFLEEQIEEEATVSEIVGRVKMINEDGPGLLRLDEELGARLPVAPAEPR